MVTDVPADPVFGEIDAMLGNTVKLTELLVAPPAEVTTTGPLVEPCGTGTTMELSSQLPGNPITPLKETVPCVVPKLYPRMRTDEPHAPADGAIAEINGVTVKIPPVPTTPATVTDTGPVVAPRGTWAVILVLLQFVGSAGIPLKLMLLEP